MLFNLIQTVIYKSKWAEQWIIPWLNTPCPSLLPSFPFVPDNYLRKELLPSHFVIPVRKIIVFIISLWRLLYCFLLYYDRAYFVMARKLGIVVFNYCTLEGLFFRVSSDFVLSNNLTWKQNNLLKHCLRKEIPPFSRCTYTYGQSSIAARVHIPYIWSVRPSSHHRRCAWHSCDWKRIEFLKQGDTHSALPLPLDEQIHAWTKA